MTAFSHISWAFKELGTDTFMILLWILFIECLNHFLFRKTSLYSLWLVLAAAFLFAYFAFLSSLESYTRNEYIFGFNPTNSLKGYFETVTSFILPMTN